MLNICYTWNKTACTVPVLLVDRVINEYILDVISTVTTVCLYF